MIYTTSSGCGSNAGFVFQMGFLLVSHQGGICQVARRCVPGGKSHLTEEWEEKGGVPYLNLIATLPLKKKKK